jgi:hypothetical protein
MKTKSEILIEEAEEGLYEPLDADDIKVAFEKKLYDLDIDLAVSNIEIGEDGDIAVSLIDADKIPYTISFQYDEKDGPQAFVITDGLSVSDDEEEDEEADDDDSETLFDLRHYNPAMVQTPVGTYINLCDLSWLTGELLGAMLMAAGIEFEIPVITKTIKDEYGQFISNESMDELFVNRVVHGKVKRVQAVRRVRKKRLTPKQKAGIRRAVMKRKREMRSIIRNRRKSIAVRKRRHLKTSHLPKNFRVRR